MMTLLFGRFQFAVGGPPADATNEVVVTQQIRGLGISGLLGSYVVDKFVEGCEFSGSVPTKHTDTDIIVEHAMNDDLVNNMVSVADICSTGWTGALHYHVTHICSRG